MALTSRKTNDKGKKNVVWSTKRVDEWMSDYAEGIIRKESPWADGVIGVRNPDIVFEYTPEEIIELKRCADDIIYFANKYCYCLQGSKGYQPITLRNYQEDMLNSYVENRFNVVLSCRQIGKTVIAAIFIMHNTIFNFDNNVGIAANKFQTAVEIMDKIKEMMFYLPFFMKPGVKTNNQALMSFNNGCRIIAQATTKKSFIGYTIHTLYLDEFAHVEPHVLDEFYENIMPTVSSMEDSKIIITSTPNGYNKFYDIYQDAVDGKNSFHPIRVDWWEVPGRNDDWKEKMIADCGGEDEFMRQYGNSFLTTGNTLLSPDSLAKLQKGRIKYKYKDIAELDKYWEDEYYNLIFHPDFDIDTLRDENEKWILSIDLSEGGGGDNSVINFFRLKLKDTNLMDDLNNPDKEIKKSDYFQLRQVGVFKDNMTPLEKLAKLVYVIVMKVIGSDNVKIVVEYNAFGGEFIRLLQSVFGEKNEFDMSTVLKFQHTLDSKIKKYGLKVKNDNKPIFCMALKQYIANDNIVITEDNNVSEFEVFSKIGNSWKASRDHDDMAMTAVNVSAVFDHPYFEVMMEEILSLAENADFYKAYEEKLDEEYANLYDNYMNMTALQQPQPFVHKEPDQSGYFSNNGIYS